MPVDLKLVGEEAKPHARRLIQESEDQETLCRCLKLLGEEAKPHARRLLQESQDQEVLCRCLELLGEEAAPFATESLRSWKQTRPVLLVRCFRIAGTTPEGIEAAGEMLEEWNQSVPPPLRVAALRARVDHPLRAERAGEVLASWHKQYRPLVTAALVARQDQPEDVTDVCREILRRWHPEIDYQIKKGLRRYEGYIWKALTHPDLRRRALAVTQQMLEAETRQPGFVGPLLLEAAQGIQEGEWPPWIAVEEAPQGAQPSPASDIEPMTSSSAPPSTVAEAIEDR